MSYLPDDVGECAACGTPTRGGRGICDDCEQPRDSTGRFASRRPVEDDETPMTVEDYLAVDAAVAEAFGREPTLTRADLETVVTFPECG